MCGDRECLIQLLIAGHAQLIAGDAEDGLADGIGTAARFFRPTDLLWSGDGKRVVVADTGGHRLRVLERASRRVSTVKSSDRLNYPTGLVWDRRTAAPESAVFLISGGQIRRVNLVDGEVSTIRVQCSSDLEFAGLEPLPCGALLAYTSHSLYAVQPDTGRTQRLAGIGRERSVGRKRELTVDSPTRPALKVSFSLLQSLAVSEEEKCVYASDFHFPLLRVTLPPELFITR
jgi:hypothetical protein